MDFSEVECQAFRDAGSDYLDGQTTAEKLAAVEEHLALCATCSDFCDALRKTCHALGALRESEPVEGAEVKALRHYQSYYPEPEYSEGESDWTEVKRLWGRLLGMPEEGRLRAIKESSDFVGAPLFNWLLIRARRVCSSNPSRAVSLATAALIIGRERERRFGDTRCLALGLSCLAWCLIVLRDYPPAERLLQEAAPLCENAGHSIEERVRYVYAKGLFCAETGQANESENLLEEALLLERARGNRRGIVCALVNIALAAMNRGDVRRGLDLYVAADELLQPESDPPRLQLTVYSNLVIALCESGRPSEAVERMPRVVELADTIGGWYWKAYTVWLTGTLARAEGRYEDAAEIFGRVRGEFLAREHLVLFLEASLDLARTRLQQGRFQDLAELATELLAEAGKQSADERIMSSVACFAEAVSQETLSGQLIASLAVALRRVKSSQHSSG